NTFKGANAGSGNFDVEAYVDPTRARAYHIIENRDFYTNTQKPGYTPYIYPHPLTRLPLMAASCNSADVQAAIDSSIDGDTVYVPAGSCTWTTGISISKWLNVIANGTVTLADNTCNGFCTNVNVISITESPVGSTRVQGFTINQGTAQHAAPAAVIFL